MGRVQTHPAPLSKREAGIGRLFWFHGCVRGVMVGTSLEGVLLSRSRGCFCKVAGPQLRCLYLSLFMQKVSELLC